MTVWVALLLFLGVMPAQADAILGVTRPESYRYATAGGGGSDAAVGTHVSSISTASTNNTTAIVITAGSTVVCGVSWGTSNTFTSISDTAGNTWTELGVEVVASGRESRMYFCEDCIGHATDVFTLDVVDSAGNAIACVELDNVAADSNDQIAYNSDSTSEYGNTDPTITPTVSYSVLVGYTGIDDISTASISSTSSMVLQETHDGSTGTPFGLLTRVLTSTSAVTMSFTRTNTNDTTLHLANFKD